MPKALARSKMMARESSETVEDNGIVSSSEVNKHLMDNAVQEVVVMIMMDQEGNLTSSLRHVIKVGPEHEAAVVQVEHLAPGLQAVTPGFQTGTLLQTMNQVAAGNGKAQTAAKQVKTDLYAIGDGATKKSQDIVKKSAAAASKSLETFLKTAF